MALEFEQEPAREEGAGTLAEFLEQVALVADSDQIPDEDEDGARRHHADDAAHRQGPGVPGGVPDRHGGRRLPAHARARPDQGAGGGAPAGVRRHHPRPRAAVPDPVGDAQRLGPALVQPAVPVPGGDPGRALQWTWTAHRWPRARVADARLLGAVVGPAAASGLGFATRRAGQAGDLAGRRRPGHPRHVRARHGGRGDGHGRGQAEATIDFGDETPKRLLLRYAPVEKL